MTAPYQAHSQTSFEAALAVEPKLSRLQAVVLRFIEDRPHSTDNEIIAGTGLAPSSARPRRIELVKLGKVVQCGTQVQPNGRKAAVWMAAQ